MMLLWAVIRIPRATLFDALMLAAIAWVAIATVHLVTPSRTVRRVTYTVIAAFDLLWLTGVIRFTSASGT